MFLTCLVLSFGISLASTGWLTKHLGKELLDIPNSRSSHSRPVLRGGGLGFVIAFAITGLIMAIANIPDLGIKWSSYSRIWFALIPLTIIGYIDDRQDVSAAVRYLVQLLSAIIAVISFGTVPIPGLSQWGVAGLAIGAIISVVAVTALINFYNFMDGLDGFVASIVAVQLGFISAYLNQPVFGLLVAALGGFLWWNWSPAKIFMGDVGSTVLGAAVAIALLSGRSDVLAWSALSVTFPLIGDSIYTLARRLLKKENIFQPHRTHIYQRLHQSGLSHDKVTLIYIVATVIAACVTYWLGFFSIGVNLLLTIIAIAFAEFYLSTQSIKGNC